MFQSNDCKSFSVHRGVGGTYNRLTIRDYNINFLFATFSLTVAEGWSLAMAGHLALHLHLRINDPEVSAEEL